MTISLLILGALTILLIWLIVMMFKKSNIFILIPVLIVGMFIGYSIFSIEGSLRLAMFAHGEIVEAYTMSFKEHSELRDDNKKYFEATGNVYPTTSQTVYFETKEYIYGYVKISKYYGHMEQN